MTKKKSNSETLDSSTQSTSTEVQTPETVTTPEPKVEAPKPKFTGPLIAFRNIEVKAGGVVSVQCLDDKVPLGKIQIIQIQTVDATYVYRRV